MSILDKAVKHFESVIAESKVYKITVEEWDEEIYFKPLESLRAETVNVIMQARKRGDVDGLIEILIARALDQNGKKLFKSVEFDVIKRQVSPVIIARIIERMNAEDAADMVDPETAGKP